MTPNVTISPSEGSPQVAGTFANFFINPPILPPISETTGNLYAAMLDQLAGFQISLFQHLFPVPQDPNYEKTTFGNVGSTEQLQAILIDINNIKSTVLALNQITGTAANRVPANASIDTNPNFTFLDNSVINACNTIALDVINGRGLQSAQLDYPALRNLLNPFYGY